MKLLKTLLIFCFWGASFQVALAKSKVLKVGLNDAYPWSYYDVKQKKVMGAEKEIIEAAFKEVRIQVEFHVLGYARLVKEFQEKRLDFASPITKQDGTKIKAYFTKRFVPFVDVVASFEKENIQLTNLYKKRFIAYQNASQYLGPKYQKAVANSKSYTELPGRENQILMLKLGRVDYIVGEQNILHGLAKKLFPKRKLYTNLIIKDWKIGPASLDKNLQEKFNQGLKKLLAKDGVQKILKRYKIIR
ncbi:hypothetical protein A9Q84_15270 [Halobacteriovorax marinus]|uniref:Solute-binding protein family 3/N-terminal domain-containing protein n=1 Tax=Halobacteriovorax marinus TaxID=97084 RepID=A0A1Y5F5B9_9BACT|nr:hypothetical protein A9Q84_15270 [Halobacteriovorax marinus]